MSKLKGTSVVGFWKWLKDFTFNEAHLLILGAYSGFMAVRPKPRHKPIDRLNWKNNKWYWKGGYILGYLIKAVLVAAGVISGKLKLPV